MPLNHPFITTFIEGASHKLNGVAGVRGIFWKPVTQLEFSFSTVTNKAQSGTKENDASKDPANKCGVHWMLSAVPARWC